MTDRPDQVRALVLKLEGERPWVAAVISESTCEVISVEDFDEWKAKALPLVCGDWQCYEIREAILNIPQATLDALFEVGPIDVAVTDPA